MTTRRTAPPFDRTSALNRHRTFIRFVDGPPKPKTRTWFVVADERSITLGVISWWGPWKRYAFSPAANTVFEEQCLRDIAEFCVERTREHKRGSRKPQEIQ